MEPGNAGNAGEELPWRHFGTVRRQPVHWLRPVPSASYKSIQKLLAIYRWSIDIFWLRAEISTRGEEKMKGNTKASVTRHLSFVS